MRPRVRKAFRAIGRFLADLIKRRRETNGNIRMPEPCSFCGQLCTRPTPDGGWTCSRCDRGDYL